MKDKWRNLTLAASRPPGFTFRVSYMNAELLQRVREVKAQVEEKKKKQRRSETRKVGLSLQDEHIAKAQAEAAQNIQAHGDLGYHA